MVRHHGQLLRWGTVQSGLLRHALLQYGRLSHAQSCLRLDHRELLVEDWEAHRRISWRDARSTLKGIQELESTAMEGR